MPQPLEEVLSEVDVADRGFALKGPASRERRNVKAPEGWTPDSVSLHLRDEFPMNSHERS